MLCTDLLLCNLSLDLNICRPSNFGDGRVGKGVFDPMIIKWNMSQRIRVIMYYDCELMCYYCSLRNSGCHNVVRLQKVSIYNMIAKKTVIG